MSDNVLPLGAVGVEIPQTSSQDPNIRIVQMFKLITMPNCFIAIVIRRFSNTKYKLK